MVSKVYFKVGNYSLFPVRGIIPKTHDGLFERIVWHDIFLTLGRFVTLTGNHERLTPLLARRRECPMGRRCAWPDDTTLDAVPPERIACWLWTSAGVTANRAQRWLEPYTQHLKLGQWHSRTAQEARTWAVAKLAQPRKAAPGEGTRATTPGPSTTQSSMAPISFAITFPPVPNLGIGTLTQDDNVIMENTATVPQASLAYATTTVSSTLSVHDTNDAFSIVGIRYCHSAPGIVSKCRCNGASGIVGERGRKSARGIVGI